MSALFLYGTLQHRPLLTEVLGRQPDTVAAALPDHAVARVAGESHPSIRSAPGARAQGLVLRDASAEEIARLVYYEGGYGYSLQPVTVETEAGAVAAQVFVPDDPPETDGPFDLAAWAARWGEMTTLAAAEVMAHRGRDPAEAIAPLRPFFLARAWARMLARKTPPQSLRTRMTRADMHHYAETPGFDGFFRIRKIALDYPTYRGGSSGLLEREAMVAYDAALVLPYDPATDAVLLIEQLRYGPLARGDGAPWTLEPVAGLVDAGEDPEDCARREAVEEARLEIARLEKMVAVYASPGYSTEFFHCFLGIADLAGKDRQIAGLDAENEDIRSHVIPFHQALSLIETGEINAGPLVMMLLWLRAERGRLRAAT